MTTVIKIKRSSVQGKAPTTSDIQAGELALNTRDKKLFSSNGSSVFEVGANLHSLSVGTGGFVIANGEIAFPEADGAIGHVLKTDGAGQLFFEGPDIGYTNSTVIFESLFVEDITEPGLLTVELGLLGIDIERDAFGALIDGQISDWMEPAGRLKTINLGLIE